ncbi:tRNA lysidine(34) synthetase TilS [Pisciglobus halotolerans]|uniref:tRNA(Ile)-lysidine synthase n=1 Tax=Pisciglobus halotolerans TaxID=745365 RepID=A0A1I3D3T2_9LACT|nr:tRNA lysidine(34) synthetase TilS [Pisciglobus halotolerans]SFH81373.1 tRNA(Ile)-lysidine synthase [Pisciglobus halotolerans]
MTLLKTFIAYAKQQALWEKKDRLLLAVSGGVDSMVLLDLMCRLPEEEKPWIGVVHVNHQLRPASDIEQSAVQNICEEKQLPFFTACWPKEEHPSVGTEAAARSFRYAFFLQVMRKQQATRLVTAHHGDDQMETILMRLVRGGQLESIAGIKEQRSFGSGKLIRPLLRFAKEELTTYSDQEQLLYFEDESNQSMMYTRNRYRHQVLPLLKEENTQALEHFADFSADLLDATAAIKHVVEPCFERLCHPLHSNGWGIDRSAFLAEAPFMQRLVLKELLTHLYRDTAVEYRRHHVEMIASLIAGDKVNGELHLPAGWLMKRRYEELYFVRSFGATLEHSVEPIPLSLGDWQIVPGLGKIGLFCSTAVSTAQLSHKRMIWLKTGEVQLPLQVRTRRPGDRMTIKGLERGSKKIKDILIDQKVPLEDRNKPIILTDAAGQIIWLIDYKESRLSNKQETDTIQYVLIYEKD